MTQLNIDDIYKKDLEYNDNIADMGEVKTVYAFDDDSLIVCIYYTKEHEADIRKAMLHDEIKAHIKSGSQNFKVSADIESLQLFRKYDDCEDIMGYTLNLHKPPQPTIYLYKA